MQEEDADADADPATSEGIFVAGGDVADVGDVVRVRGTVSESFGRTQLGSITAAEVCPGEGAVTATEGRAAAVFGLDNDFRLMGFALEP